MESEVWIIPKIFLPLQMLWTMNLTTLMKSKTPKKIPSNQQQTFQTCLNLVINKYLLQNLKKPNTSDVADQCFIDYINTKKQNSKKEEDPKQLKTISVK